MALDGTYAGLVNSVADWLNRVGSPEVAAASPDFIRLFESQFDKLDIRHPKATVRATTPLESEYTALPADFVEMQRLRVSIEGVDAFATLRYLTPEEFEDEHVGRDAAALPRQPAFYTVSGGELQIKPYSADNPATIEMLYWGKVPRLNEVTNPGPPEVRRTSNWLLLEAPEAYLYGALVEATPFLRDDERLGMWAKMRDDAVGRLRDAAERARHTAGTLKPRRRKLG